MSKRGLVRTTKLVRKYEPNLQYIFKEFQNFTNIQVCSSNASSEYIGLSPLKLGPIRTGDRKFPICKNLENFWNWSKVFQNEVSSPSSVNEKSIVYFGDYNQEPKPEYFANRKKWFLSDKADLNRMRRGKKNKDDFIYCLYDNEKIEDYIECRKTFYCYLYAVLADKTSAYIKLEQRLFKGENICLTGWDAVEWSEDDDPECNILKDILENKNQVFGHEQVLACMLIGNRIWDEYK